VTRLFAIAAELPAAKSAIRQQAQALVPADRAGDFAQALMDLGATICTPVKPACALCPWHAACRAAHQGLQETFPRKARKKPGRPRYGVAFWAVRGEAEVLLRTRPPRGLLGGMTEVPTSAWTHAREAALTDAPAFDPPHSRWHRLAGSVTHVFTHFPLELVVYAARIAPATPAPPGTRWVALAALAGEALPSLMRKVVTHATMGASSDQGDRTDADPTY
jgi:A/G-specific adenine glycosylase